MSEAKARPSSASISKRTSRRLIDAYHDREGVTAAFNLNLLARINRELDGDFPLDRFVHEARWNASDSAIEMHLVSLDARRVAVCGEIFPFEAGETIHTESSRKYDLDIFAILAESTGWRATKVWMDGNRHFAVFGLKPALMTDTQNLQYFVERHPRLFVLTGPGCSTGSGIPDYRDAEGQWNARRR